jgi:C4-dicarboxylate transporter DctM subunit
MELFMLFGGVIFLLILGIPIALSVGLSSIAYLLLNGASMTSIAVKLFDSSQHYTLLAIPFFILSSSFMTTGGMARRVVDLAIVMVGWFRGGMAMAGVMACTIFAALSGSSPATVVAVGRLAIEGMERVGYSKRFAAGVVCNAGTLGILIPPSIVMVVYAAATDVSVGRMFLGGMVPGILASVLLMAVLYVVAPKRKVVLGEEGLDFEGRSKGEVVLRSVWGLLMIVLILGGIYGGIFTPTEAAAVAAVYSFFVAHFVHRDMGVLKGKPFVVGGEGFLVQVFRGLWDTLKAFPVSFFHADTKKSVLEAARTTVMLMFIIVNALLFAYALTLERVPQMLVGLMLEYGFEAWSFLLIVNLVLLLGGQFMEPSGLLLIVAPLVFPVALELGIDPIHLGIVMVVNMEIGMITPPVGLNLFVTSGITGLDVVSVLRGVFPWLVMMLFFLIVVTYVPWISTFLPNMVMGPEIVTE